MIATTGGDVLKVERDYPVVSTRYRTCFYTPSLEYGAKYDKFIKAVDPWSPKNECRANEQSCSCCKHALVIPSGFVGHDVKSEDIQVPIGSLITSLLFMKFHNLCTSHIQTCMWEVLQLHWNLALVSNHLKTRVKPHDLWSPCIIFINSINKRNIK